MATFNVVDGNNNVIETVDWDEQGATPAALQRSGCTVVPTVRAPDQTDPTHGGGSASGRLRIVIAGTTRYIPYY